MRTENGAFPIPHSHLNSNSSPDAWSHARPASRFRSGQHELIAGLRNDCWRRDVSTRRPGPQRPLPLDRSAGSGTARRFAIQPTTRRPPVVQQRGAHMTDGATSSTRAGRRSPSGIVRQRDERVGLVFRAEPCDRHVAGPGAHGRTVDGARLDLPAVGVHCRPRRPPSRHQPRDENIAHLFVAPVSKRDDWSFRRRGDGGRAAIADPCIDRRFLQLPSGPAEHRGPQAHVAGRLRRLGIRGASVEPDQTQARAGGLKERRETMLGLRAVVMRAHGLRPCRPRYRSTTPGAGYASGSGPFFLHPVGHQRAAGERANRRHVRRVDDEVAAETTRRAADHPDAVRSANFNIAPVPSRPSS